MDPFFKKAALITSMLSLITGTVVYTSVSPSIKVFSFDGSSSMKNAIDLLTSSYNREKNKFDSSIHTVGSNGGLSKLFEAKTDFALVSYSVKDVAEGLYKSQWSSKKLQTITLAKEAIVILYKVPKGCSDELVVSKSNIKNIYKLFSGHQENESDLSEINLKTLLSTEKQECNVNVKAFAKNGGPKKSGTAYSFFDNKDLISESNGDEENNDSSYFTKVKSEIPGNHFNIQFVPESNNLSWENFKNNISDGSMIYFPSSFVFQNYDEITKLGLKIAKFKKNGSTIDLDKNNYFEKISDSSYSWTRSLNLIFSTENLEQEKKDFISYIVKNTCKLKEIFLVPINYKIKEDAGKEIAQNAVECKSDSTSEVKKEAPLEIKLFEEDEKSCKYGLENKNTEKKAS